MSTKKVRLTRRETEILRAMVSTKSQKEIGEQFFISFDTVDSHSHSFKKKIGLSGRPAVMLFALKRGLVSLEDVPDPAPGVEVAWEESDAERS